MASVKKNGSAPRNGDAMQRLIEAFKILPNVGDKTAQRIAFHLLQEQRDGARELADAVDNALKMVRHCASCNTLCEEELCPICQDPERDRTRLMIVGMPSDIVSIEAAKCHRGVYFVLGGDLSPLEGSAPDEELLTRLVHKIVDEDVREIIIGTSFTSSGETTAFVLGTILGQLDIPITRLARGIPLGGELEYIDHGTLAQSFYNRQIINRKK